jgi:sugar/nucleoside kinase (ribokinase family)
MVDLSSGERCVVYAHTHMRKLRSESIPAAILEDAQILMLDGHYLPQAIELAAMARPRGIPVVLDGGSWKEGLDVLLPLLDYAVCSDNFYPPGCSDKESVITYLRRAGIEHVAITRNEEPIIVHHQGKTMELPVLEVDALDTMGAGDIFHGAFCHFLLHEDFLASLEGAAKIAGVSCTSLGTRAWIDLAKIE